jgi:hypothetical protein
VRGTTALGTSLTRWATAFGRAFRRLLAGEELKTAAGRRLALVVGPAAVAVGAALSVPLSPVTEGVADVVIAVLVALAWAAARLVVIRVAAGSHASHSSQELTACWAAGLIPYAAAVSPLLRLLAWAASLLLTRVYLDRTSHGPRDGARVMLWVAGFEVVAALGLWVTGAIAPILPL